jgi:ligand-binding SRPBCC domain-containing protein
MEEGSITDFTLWMGPIPIRWRALHTNIIPLQRFTDTQIDGPFEHWVHKHQFRQVDETTTEVIDIIRAEFKSDIFYRLIGRLIWMSLPFLFSYRSWKTKKILKLSRL